MLCNGVELYKYNHPHSLNELSVGDKLINEYVECKIDRYIVTPVSEYLTDQYTGQSELYFDFMYDMLFSFFTIPVRIRLNRLNPSISEILFLIFIFKYPSFLWKVTLP